MTEVTEVTDVTDVTDVADVTDVGGGGWRYRLFPDVIGSSNDSFWRGSSVVSIVECNFNYSVTYDQYSHNWTIIIYSLKEDKYLYVYIICLHLQCKDKTEL